MGQLRQLLQEAVEQVEQYVQSTLALAKLKALQTASQLLSNWMFQIILLLVMSMFLLLLSIGLSLWWGELLGKLYYGFFITASLFLVAAVLVKRFLPPFLKQSITRQLLNQWYESESTKK